MPESLFVVSNRAFDCKSPSNCELKDNLNAKGSKELRIFEARPRKKNDPELKDWKISVVPDEVSPEHFRKAKVKPLTPAKDRRPHLNGSEPYRGSDLVAARLTARLREDNHNLLIFIHGYNNTVEDACRRAWRIAERYQIEVVIFSWPANGGGEWFLEDLHGTASYKSDKSDARASIEALDRMLNKTQLLMNELNRAFLPKIREEALEAHPGDRYAQRRMIAGLLRERACPFKVTLMAHSMGNYLLKKTLLSSSDRLSAHTIFDNVILKAADTNHENHAEWVQRLLTRQRVYIVVNQGDDALRLSMMKIGEEQKPRLGNSLLGQEASNAVYIDCSLCAGDRHSYFDELDFGEERPRSLKLVRFFERILNGEAGEPELPFHQANNTYRIE